MAVPIANPIDYDFTSTNLLGGVVLHHCGAVVAAATTIRILAAGNRSRIRLARMDAVEINLFLSVTEKQNRLAGVLSPRSTISIRTYLCEHR